MDAAFPSLEILKISNCYGRESFLERGLSSSLKHIGIEKCWKDIDDSSSKWIEAR